MCLACPAKVIELKQNGKIAVCEHEGFFRKKEAMNVEKAELGEWVLVQQGIVVEKLSEEEASELAKSD